MLPLALNVYLIFTIAHGRRDNVYTLTVKQIKIADNVYFCESINYVAYKKQCSIALCCKLN
jgi:hypothetical protein